MMWTEFLLTSLIVVLTPGTGVIYTVGIGLARGVRASTAAAAGCTSGILPHMAAAMLGVAALLQTSATAFELFKLAGVAYLVYLAWATLRERGALDIAPHGGEAQYGQLARTGFLINILNPKLSIFFLAFLPQFVPDDVGMPLVPMLTRGGIFMAMTFGVFMLYGACAGAMRAHVVSNPRVMTGLRWCFAAAFLLLGLRLFTEHG